MHGNVALTLLRYQAKQFSSRFLFHWLCSVYMSACVIGRVLREKKMQKQVSSRGKTGIHERGLGFTSTCGKKGIETLLIQLMQNADTSKINDKEFICWSVKI